MAKQEQKLFRLSQAAHELGLHPITVRRWIKAGRIQAIQVGREVRIPRTEIEKIVGTLVGRLIGRAVCAGQWSWAKRGFGYPNRASARLGRNRTEGFLKRYFAFEEPSHTLLSLLKDASLEPYTSIVSIDRASHNHISVP
jgi:excisionase family DNA binding protein